MDLFDPICDISIILFGISVPLLLIFFLFPIFFD